MCPYHKVAVGCYNPISRPRYTGYYGHACCHNPYNHDYDEGMAWNGTDLLGGGPTELAASAAGVESNAGVVGASHAEPLAKLMPKAAPKHYCGRKQQDRKQPHRIELGVIGSDWSDCDSLITIWNWEAPGLADARRTDIGQQQWQQQWQRARKQHLNHF